MGVIPSTPSKSKLGSGSCPSPSPPSLSAPWNYSRPPPLLATGPPLSPPPSGSLPLLLDPPRPNHSKLGLAGAFWHTARSRSQPGNSFRRGTKGLLGREGQAGHASSPVEARSQPGQWWIRGRAGVSDWDCFRQLQLSRALQAAWGGSVAECGGWGAGGSSWP